MARGASGDLVLLVGTYRPAVAAARALDRRGRRVIAGKGPDLENIEGSGGVEVSRHVRRVWRHPAFRDDPKAFLTALAREIEWLNEPVYVFPFFEPVLILLSRERARLPANARLVAPAPEVVEICIDKQRCLDEAEAAGLPSLPRETVGTIDELHAAADRIGAVAIRPVQPRTRLAGRKAILCRNAEEVLRQLPTWPEGHDRLLIQRLADGLRLNIHFAARKGRLLGCVEVAAIRTDRLDGTGLTVEGHTRPPSAGVVEQLGRLVGRLGYTGVGLAQFVLDGPANDPYLIELNPRLASGHVIAERAGLDLTNLAVDLAAGLPVAEPLPYAHDRRIISAWTLGDFAGLVDTTLDGTTTWATRAAWLRRLVVTALRADVHATWSWHDPLPAVVTWSSFLLALLRRGGRRLVRRP